MADRTLCTGAYCTRKAECLRYVRGRDGPHSDWQSWALPLPTGKDELGHPLPIDGCDIFMPLEK